MKYTFIVCLTVAALLVTSLMNSCSKNEIVVADDSSFGLIQDKILTSNCATSNCHASKSDGTFAQHGLILSKGNAYKNLFNVDPKNANAKQDGLKLVKAFSSLESLLYHKLNYDYSHHSAKNYGSAMPMGGNQLTVGQVEFIRRWIEAGAPEKGNVADAALLEDKTPTVVTPFSALTPPAAGNGYQMKLGPFEVAPDFERELFIRKPLGNAETVYINRIQLKMRPGSHHFILYGFRDLNNLAPLDKIRDLRNPDKSLNLSTVLQMSNHVFNFGGSEADLDYTFPEGTAVKLPANTTFDMNSHYFNRGISPLLGEVYINLFTTKKENVVHPLKVLDLGNNSLNILPNQKTIISKDFSFNKDVKIVMLFSHTHQMGEKFEILIKGGARNGELVYTSTDWEHPAKINYSPYISLKKGEGLTSRITYNNQTNKTVNFGLTTEDEMGIIFGYYYEE